jgi:L-lactate utilization protein LutB
MYGCSFTELVDMYLVLVESNRNTVVASRSYREKYLNFRVSNCPTFLSVYHQLRET